MKTARYLFILILTAATFQGVAQVFKPYRQPYLQAMYIDSSRYYGQELDSTAYIGANNILQLYTGEQLFLDAVISNKQLTAIRSIEPDSLRKPSFTVEVTQQANGVMHSSVTLTITNHLKKGVWVMVSAFEVGKTDWTEDKPLFIPKGSTATMVWREPMASVLISEWKLK
jgi:hypothetical protein